MSSSISSSTVEVKLKPVRVSFFNAKNLVCGQFNNAMLRHFWTQVGKGANLKELKKRVIDHIEAAGVKVADTDVRMWLSTESDQNTGDSNLIAKCQQVKLGYSNKGLDTVNGLISEDSRMEEGEVEADVEENSGIEFPGQSLEPLLNSALRVSQLNAQGNNNIVVEFRPSARHMFAFKYKKGQKLVIGVCEYCNSRHILRSICKCKNVKYCND